MLLGLSGGLDVDPALNLGAAGVGTLTGSFLGVRVGCSQAAGVVLSGSCAMGGRFQLPLEHCVTGKFFASRMQIYTPSKCHAHQWSVDSNSAALRSEATRSRAGLPRR